MNDGKRVWLLPDKAIIFWDIFWRFKLVIYNNSNYPAYNIKIESTGSRHFKELDTLPNVNNLKPLGNLDLTARLVDFTEGISDDADRILKARIPRRLQDIKLKISCYDDLRKLHVNEISFTETEILNRKII